MCSQSSPTNQPSYILLTLYILSLKTLSEACQNVNFPSLRQPMLKVRRVNIIFKIHGSHLLVTVEILELVSGWCVGVTSYRLFRCLYCVSDSFMFVKFPATPDMLQRRCNFLKIIKKCLHEITLVQYIISLHIKLAFHRTSHFDLKYIFFG